MSPGEPTTRIPTSLFSMNEFRTTLPVGIPPAQLDLEMRTPTPLFPERFESSITVLCADERLIPFGNPLRV